MHQAGGHASHPQKAMRMVAHGGRSSRPLVLNPAQAWRGQRHAQPPAPSRHPPQRPGWLFHHWYAVNYGGPCAPSATKLASSAAAAWLVLTGTPLRPRAPQHHRLRLHPLACSPARPAHDALATCLGILLCKDLHHAWYSRSSCTVETLC